MYLYIIVYIPIHTQAGSSITSATLQYICARRCRLPKTLFSYGPAVWRCAIARLTPSSACYILCFKVYTNPTFYGYIYYIFLSRGISNYTIMYQTRASNRWLDSVTDPSRVRSTYIVWEIKGDGDICKAKGCRLVLPACATVNQLLTN